MACHLYYSLENDRKEIDTSLSVDYMNIKNNNLELVTTKTIPNLYKKVEVKLNRFDIKLVYKIYYNNKDIQCSIKNCNFRYFNIDHDPIDGLTIKPLFTSIRNKNMLNKLIQELKVIGDLTEDTKIANNFIEKNINSFLHE